MRKTILLVEDEAIIAIEEARTIKRFGYNVVTAHSGNEAIAIATGEKNIDLVLMDIDLGRGINGPEAAAQILKNRSTPIVFLTSHSEREMVEKVRGITRYGYVIKNSGDFVLQSSIEMALELFETNGKLKNELLERKRAEDERQEARGLLEAAVSQSPSGILIADAPHVTIRLANRSAFNIRGGDQRILTGIEVAQHAVNWQTFRPDGSPYPPEQLPLSRAVLKGEETHSEEVIIRDEQGKDHWVSVNAAPIRDGAGRITAGIVIFHDITERKRAEEDLRAGEFKFRSFVEQSTEGYVLTDERGIIIEWNRALAEMSGVQREEALGQFLWDIQFLFSADEYRTSESNERVKTAILRMLQTGQMPKSHMEYHYRRHDGARGVAQQTVFAIKTAEGFRIGATARDITDRKQAEDALCESENRLQSIFRAAPTGIGVVRNRILTEVNAFICEMTGYVPEELVGKSARILYPTQEEFEYVGREKHRLIAEKGTGSVETRWMKKDGLIIDVLLSSTPIDLNDLGIGVTFAALDITERKRAEEQLAKLNERFLMFGTDPLVNINLLVALCGEQLDATCALYNRLQAGMLCSLGQWHTPPGFRSTDQPEGHLCYDVIQSADDAALVVRNLTETTYAHSDPNVGLYGLKTYIGKAVKFDGVNVGSLCVVFQHDVVPSDSDKRLMEIIASAIGVEEARRRAMENLKESEERFRTLFEQSNDAIFIHDDQGHMLNVNQRAMEMLGYSGEELLALPTAGYHPPEVIGEAMTAFNELAKVGHVRFDSKFRKKDGSVIEVSISTRAVESESKMFQAIVRDITERKRTEESLRTSEERFRELLKNIPAVAVQGYGIDGLTQYWNQASERIYGYTAQEAVGRNLLDLIIPPEIREGVRQAIQHMAETGQPIPASELSLMRKDGSRVAVYSSHAVVQIPGRDPELFCVDIDLSEYKRAEKELHASEERFRRLFQDHSAIKIVIDPESGKIADANIAAADFYGWSIEQLRNMQIQQINTLAPSAVGNKMEEAKSSERARFEFQHRRADDSVRDVEVYSNAIEIGGKPLLHSIIHDITDRKQAEKNIKEIITKNPMSIQILDKDGCTLEVNNSFKLLFGSAPPPGYSIFNDIQFAQQGLSEIFDKLRTGEIVRFPDVCFNPHDSISGLQDVSVWTRTIGFPLNDSNDKPAKFVLMHENITDRKLIENELKEKEGYQRALLDNFPFAVWLKDVESRFLLVNKGFVHTFGAHDADELMGKNDFDIAPRDMAEGYRADDRAVMDSRQKKNVEELILTQGMKKWFETYKAPVIDDNGKLLGTVGFARDITERKQADQELKAALTEKTVLLKEIHHRVKNNLQIISSLLNLQSDEIDDPAMKELFEDTKNRVRSMALIHEKMYQSENLSQIDLGDYLRSITGRLIRSYGREEVTCLLDVSDIVLKIDEALPCGLIINEMVTNSLKHAFPKKEDGEIRITIRQLPAKTTELVVEDNGIGFPVGEDFRTMTSMGMGLILSLTEQLRGTIELERSKGTRFRIVFSA